MKVSDAIVEFGFDCKVRKLSEKTVITDGVDREQDGK